MRLTAAAKARLSADQRTALTSKRLVSEPLPPDGDQPSIQSVAKGTDSGPSTGGQWQRAVRSLARFALFLPLVVFLLTLSGEPTLKATLGPLSYQPVSGLRAMAAITLAILLVKLTRDAHRLAAFYNTANIDIEFTEKVSTESNIVDGYVRPSDLLHLHRRTDDLRFATILDQMRTLMIGAVFGVTALGTLVVLLSSIGDVASTIALPPWLARSAVAVVVGLVLVAAFDLLGIAAIAIRAHQRWRYRDKASMEALQKLDDEWRQLKRRPAKPLAWPPEGEELVAFQRDVERQKKIEWCEAESDALGARDILPPGWPLVLFESDLESVEAQIREVIAQKKVAEFAAERELDGEQRPDMLRKLLLHEETAARIDQLKMFGISIDLPNPRHAIRIHNKSKFMDDDGLDDSFKTYEASFADIHEGLSWLEDRKAKAEWCWSQASGDEQMELAAWYALSENQLRADPETLNLR